jgi:hypothetical protein
MLRVLKNKRFGQVTVEFSFTMVIAFLMLYAMIKIFDWSARDLIDRQRAHESLLSSNEASTGTHNDYTSMDDSHQLIQISPYFFGSRDMNAIYKGK